MRQPNGYFSEHFEKTLWSLGNALQLLTQDALFVPIEWEYAGSGVGSEYRGDLGFTMAIVPLATSH